MTITFRGATAVLLPGTGSDDDYVYRAFAGPLHGVGAVVSTPAPQPARLVASYLDALDNAARQGPIIVGGVSIGAAVTVAWALAHPSRAVAVLAALPAWTGAAHVGARRAVGPAHRPPVAHRRSGRHDRADAGVQPGLAGRRARPAAGWVSGPSCPTRWRKPPATSRRASPNWNG